MKYQSIKLYVQWTPGISNCTPTHPEHHSAHSEHKLYIFRDQFVQQEHQTVHPKHLTVHPVPQTCKPRTSTRHQIVLLRASNSMHTKKIKLYSSEHQTVCTPQENQTVHLDHQYIARNSNCRPRTSTWASNCKTRSWNCMYTLNMKIKLYTQNIKLYNLENQTVCTPRKSNRTPKTLNCMYNQKFKLYTKSIKL